MSEAAAADTGPMTREQAVASLVASEEAATAPEAPVEAAAEPEEIDAGDQPAEEPEAVAENDDEGDETEADAPVAAEPPKYWSQEAKAKFALLDPELQAVVLSQEGPREEATAKAKAQAAAEVEKAQKEQAGIQALAQQLSEFLPQAVKTFQQRWGEPDWAAVATEHGAEQAFVLKAQYDQEQKELGKLVQAEQTAQATANQARVQTEWKVLAEIAPDLAPDASDPTKGSDKRQAVVKYLAADGIPQDAIAQISAKEMRIAHKAMLWDQAQAALKAPKTPKPVPAIAQRAPARPAASVAQVPSAQREQLRLQNRFAQTASRDDAVALILAKGL